MQLVLPPRGPLSLAASSSGSESLQYPSPSFPVSTRIPSSVLTSRVNPPHPETSDTSSYIFYNSENGKDWNAIACCSFTEREDAKRRKRYLTISTLFWDTSNHHHSGVYSVSVFWQSLSQLDNFEENQHPGTFFFFFDAYHVLSRRKVLNQIIQLMQREHGHEWERPVQF